MGYIMANSGLKISQLVYSTLEDAVNDAAQVPLSIGVSTVKANRRIPIEELKGYQGSQGYQGVPGSSGSGTISGSGTATRHTIWTGATSIGDSIETEDSRGNMYTNTPDSVFLGGVGVLRNTVKNGTGSYFSGNCAQNNVDGTNNLFTDANNNTVIGTANIITSSSSENCIIGDSNLIDDNVNETIIFGDSNRIRDAASESQIIGRSNDITGPANIIIGKSNTMPLTYGNKIIIGNDNRCDAPESMAFGTDNYESGGGGDSHMFGHAHNLVNTSACEAYGINNHLDDLSGVVAIGKDLVISALDDNPNGVHIGIGGLGILHIHGVLQGADDVYASAGKGIGFDANGEMIITDLIANPAGSSGQVQYNDGTVMGGAPLTYTTGNSGSWYYNRFTFDRPSPTSDTKTTGISRISYINAAELMIWASSSGSNTIEICSDDTISRTTYATFNSTQSKILQAVIVPTTARTDSTTLDLDVNTRAILSGGTTCTVTATSVESGTASNTNYEVMIINNNTGVATFAGYNLAPKDTGVFSYDGSGSNWTLLSRVSDGIPLSNRAETTGTVTISPNVFEIFGTVTTMTFVLGSVVYSDIENEYHAKFISGGTASVITWPGGISWVNGVTPIILANKVYEFSIVDGLGVVAEF